MEKELKTVTPELVRGLIDYAPERSRRGTGFAETQLEGTVALLNMLLRNRCAYLADEVGTGKTYIALGVMSLIRFFQPHTRIIVIAPRENIQRKWVKELGNFVRNNWKGEGNKVKSLQGTPAWEPVVCGSLLDFGREALLNADRDFFLRMTSFSLQLKDEEPRGKLRSGIRELLPWLDPRALTGRTFETFRDDFGCALNAAVPTADLVVVDEAHNLKHGLGPRVSTRNRVMGMAFGHPEGRSEVRSWFQERVKRLLFLSATPFEEDYGAIANQLAVFGFGDAVLRDARGKDPLRIRDLHDPGVSEERKREVVARLMVRRVSALRIGGRDYTKNMYRREWRKGGYATHDKPIVIDDPRQRLIVGLIQKKVADVLQGEKFNNRFQIGMLSSFESFLQTLRSSGRKRGGGESPEGEISDSAFDGAEQTRNATLDERQGIDTASLARVVDSYRERFGKELPHPKLDATVKALEGTFESAEKTLVFVRRVAAVNELGARLDRTFDRWLRERMEEELPNLREDIGAVFERYEKERLGRSDIAEDSPAEVEEGEPEDLFEKQRYRDEEDEGGSDTFFSWFFRGKGPAGYLSGAAFQKNRLSSISAIDSTLFEDNYVGWLLGGQPGCIGALANALGTAPERLVESLRNSSYAYFRGRSRQKERYPRLYVFQAYQVAALRRLAELPGDIGARARLILEERFPEIAEPDAETPPGWPGPEVGLEADTFFSELVRDAGLRAHIWPEDPDPDFRRMFRRREQRRELLSAMARLGVSFIDLYFLAIRNRRSFSLGRDEEAGDGHLPRRFVELLARQKEAGVGLAYREFAQAAENFNLLLAVNFPKVSDARLEEIAAIYGATLQRQVPVGRMAGGVNNRLVRQFRMPGFPYVLVTTDVLQEGEDLHTFCRKVVHYGIAWTPSSIEQRTGRVDRIGGIIQRRFDGTDLIPTAEDFIQIYYPHLQETVEVLQVRRVLKRLNRFLRLMHKTRREHEQLDAHIDTAREVLEELDEIPPLTGPLESAFPVRQDWLLGDLGYESAATLDIRGLEKHLLDLWSLVIEKFEIRDDSPGDNLRGRKGVARLSRGRMLRAGAPVPDWYLDQPFRLELRSQISGDATLLKCISEVGEYDLGDEETFDRICDRHMRLGQPKICTRPLERRNRDLISIEGDILFHPQTTQAEEIEALVSRTAVAAALFKADLLPEMETPGPSGDWKPEARSTEALTALQERLDHLVAKDGLPWKRRGHVVTVELWFRGRKQEFQFRQRGDMYVFFSRVVGGGHTPRGKKLQHQLVRRAWRRNAMKDLVCFAFDANEGLTGFLEQPIDTVDHEELRFYVEILAKECDRFEYVLTGQDVN